MKDHLTIAVDFDGTIVEHRYPEIGKEVPFAIETLKQFQKDGHNLILWTYRWGKELDAAVKFCQERGLFFYAVNKNYPEEGDDFEGSRKILADIYIDDRNLGGHPGWPTIYKIIKKRQHNFLVQVYQEYTIARDREELSFLEKLFKRRGSK